MGWLKRVLGVQEDRADIVAIETGIAHDPSDMVPVDVVGEASYQAELAQIAGPKGPQGKQYRVGVTLRADPDNQYDANAVRVEVMGLLVGFLPRATAATVSPGLRTAGGAIEGQGAIVGGWKDGHDEGSYGIQVWLTDRDAHHVGLARPSPIPPPPPLRPGEVRLSPKPEDTGAYFDSVTVTYEEHYQPILETTRPSAEWNRDWWPCVVTLALVDCNPHAKTPQPCVEVRCGEHAVGYFTPAMTDRYRSAIERITIGGGMASASAQVSRGTKGGVSLWRVKVTMTKPR